MSSRDDSAGGPSLPLSRGKRLEFLDLPSEIHSQIATYLTMDELLRYLSLHPALLSLTSSHLSPFPTLIRETINRGSPYPSILAKLPSLTLYQPDDDGTLYLDVLVRARPRWILERLELGRWTEGVWREAFERRFLPSWKRYKLQGDSWRAVFLRILGRLEHRMSGCTHDESWTRFITLHRNGSASINRIYSRQFDPYQIYDELKHQNNFASEPTTVRVVVHLQDLRVIVLGVLYRYPSLFVNQNAHDLLHPPLLTEMELEGGGSGSVPESPARKLSTSEGKRPSTDEPRPTPAAASTSTAAATGSINPSANSNEIYYPLVRSLSPSTPQTTTYGLSDPSSPAPASTRRATFSSILSPSMAKIRRLSGQNVNTTAHTPMAPYPTIPIPDSPSLGQRFGSMLTLTRSRESDEGSKSGRKWSLGSGRRGSGGDKPTAGGGPIIPASALFSDNTHGNTVEEVEQAHGRVIPASALFADYHPIPPPSSVPGPSILSNPTVSIPPPPPTQPEVIPAPTSAASPPFLPTPLPPRLPQKRQLPYAPMRKPQPAPSHRLYPNHTPIPLADPDDLLEGITDRRQKYQVVEDDYAGNLWASHKPDEDVDGLGSADGADDVASWNKERYVEWDEEAGYRKRWVGPMLVIAQLHPSHHPRAQPPGVDPSSPTEGADPDLGPKGMYASLGFEDLEAIMGWVQLKGGGAYVSDPRKGGMGFDPSLA